MIDTFPCPSCEKRHRSEDAVEKCKARKERREAREQAKKDDIERRWKNVNDLPVDEFVAQEIRKGTQWDRMVTALNRDYPPKPDQTKWNLWDVVWIDSLQLIRTWGMDVEDITLLRLEKHMTGDFISDHPLRERA